MDKNKLGGLEMLNRILPLFEGETTTPSGGSGWVSIIMIVLIVVVFYFMYRSQKKQEREAAKMRDGLEVGDEITTIGGVVGEIVSIKEETIVIQVGADKVKFEMMRWAVSSVTKSSGKPAREVAEAEEAPKKAMPKRLRKSAEVEEEKTAAEE